MYVDLDSDLYFGLGLDFDLDLSKIIDYIVALFLLIFNKISYKNIIGKRVSKFSTSVYRQRVTFFFVQELRGIWQLINLGQLTADLTE